MTDQEYRQRVQAAFDYIVAAFDEIDPDDAECEEGHGFVTIIDRAGNRIVVSPQPPVHQIWVAAASRGMGIHFDWDESARRWLDDKGEGMELYGFIAETLKQAIGLDLVYAE